MDLRPLTPADKEAICTWHYEGDYSIYDLPPSRVLREKRQGFFDPARAEDYLGCWDGEVLVGYLHLKAGPKQVTVGIGVHPTLCGRGYGGQMLSLAAELSARRWPGLPLTLIVRSWNKRAISCYRRAGFHPAEDPFELETPAGKGIFLRMSRPGG